MEVTQPARSYHHGRLREALIEAGLAALERAGAHELSLRALAREVDVSANAAYRHFADKDALLAALAAEGFRRFAAAQAEAAHAGDPTGLSLGVAYVRFARDNPGLFRLMFGHFAASRTDADLQQSAVAAFGQLMQMSARHSPASGDGEQALMLALARWGLVHGLSHLLLDGQLGLFAPDAEQLIAAVLRASGLGHAASAATEDQAGAAPVITAGSPSRKATS